MDLGLDHGQVAFDADPGNLTIDKGNTMTSASPAVFPMHVIGMATIYGSAKCWPLE